MLLTKPMSVNPVLRAADCQFCHYGYGGHELLCAI